MLFNSPVYIFVFLPAVIVIYFYLCKKRFVLQSKLWLLFASFFFYGYWNPKYLILLVSSITINFVLGLYLSGKKILSGKLKIFKTKHFLFLGICFNLGLLGYFKYAGFFIENVNYFSEDKIKIQTIILPLAISFFTLQQIAYLVDVYKKKVHEYNFLNYCLFVSFFPQLIAGPIVHHKEMMPQFSKIKINTVNWTNITTGIFIFIVGLFKKLVIADSFGIWADAGFMVSRILKFYESWVTSLSYTFQLYYDFSAYTDMAIGAALLFNIQLPINFNSPYKSLNIREFWRKWHITLSRWLRDYVYIPLGGNRGTKFGIYRNIIITFILGGFWHGANWTFVIWGIMHGFALVIHRAWQKFDIKLNMYLSWFITFMFINVTWVIFRAESIPHAIGIIKGMMGLNGFGLSNEFMKKTQFFVSNVWSEFFIPQVDLYIILFFIVAIFFPNTMQITRLMPGDNRLQFRTNVLWCLYISILAFLSMLTFVGNDLPNKFLYFNF